MIDKKVMLIVPGVLFGAMVMASEVPADQSAAAKASTQGNPVFRENIGRQELLFKATELVNAANKDMVNRKYDDAIAKYREVIKMLQPVGGGSKFNDKIEFCRKRISECYYNKADEAILKAEDSASSFDFEEAVRLCDEALEFCPERREELEKYKVYYNKRREAAVNRENLDSGVLIPELEKQQAEIELLIEQGIKLVKRSEYMAARKKFEQALIIDPFNETAMHNLMVVNVRVKGAAAGRAKATARHNVGAIEWSAAIPFVADNALSEGEGLSDAPVALEKDTTSKMTERLKSIIFKDYVLVGDVITFTQAMNDLRVQAKDNDPTGHGVNFVIYPVKAEFKNEKMATYEPNGDVSLYDVLQTLEKRGDLTFRVDENAVVIAPKGVPLEKMTTEIFSYSIGNNDSEAKLKEALISGAGVTFAEGSRLTPVPVRDEIISRNTPANQKRIRQWLNANGDRGEPMVQIMFKFLEVSQKDLDELGFNWTYARHGNKVGFGVNEGNALLRHYSNEDANDRFGGTSMPGNVDDATYNLTWSDSKNSLAASVYMLDWADATDILYSPRVTTLDGTTATVNMTEKHHYPGDYDDADDESSDTTRVNIVIPQPTLDDEKELGIKFNITPNVNGDLIQAKVNFSIDQFDSWMIVDSRSEGDSSNSDSSSDSDDDSEGEYQKKAVINNRTVNTDVTLHDGDTVLIASISQDLTTIMHDKIPILGDIPFIGRLFQSKYTNSQKNNLLVFMTCKLVNPDGSAARRDPETGKPKNIGGEKGLPVFPRNQ